MHRLESSLPARPAVAQAMRHDNSGSMLLDGRNNQRRLVSHDEYR
jgi:hypothetical protein